jgi:hypothetical protein
VPVPQPRQMLGVGREMRGQELDGDVAAERLVVREKDLPHSTGAELPDDAIGADAVREATAARAMWFPLC